MNIFYWFFLFFITDSETSSVQLVYVVFASLISNVFKNRIHVRRQLVFVVFLHMWRLYRSTHHRFDAMWRREKKNTRVAKWPKTVSRATEGRRAQFKMPFQARGKKLPLALSEKRWLVCGCHVAVGRISTILSLLCSVTDSHVVHRLHNEAGLGEPADVIVSYTASGWQKDSLLQWCYNVRERERERSWGSLLVPLCNGMCFCGWRLHLLGSWQVYSCALQNRWPVLYLVFYLLWVICSNWCMLHPVK